MDGAAMPPRQLPEPMRDWAGSSSAYPRTSVSTLFEEIVRERPNAVALVDSNSELTYGELNMRANRLAHRLRSAGVEPETIVACCLRRSMEMIVAFLAVLKAGGAYLPIDPAYPKARVDLILEDIGNSLILAAKPLAPALSSNNRRIIFVEDEAQSQTTPADNLPHAAGPPGGRQAQMGKVPAHPQAGPAADLSKTPGDLRARQQFINKPSGKFRTDL